MLSSDLISSPTHPWAGTSGQHPNHITCVATEFLPSPYFSVMSPQASILLLPASCLPPPSPPICFTQGVPALLPPLHLSYSIHFSVSLQDVFFHISWLLSLSFLNTYDVLGTLFSFCPCGSKWRKFVNPHLTENTLRLKQ